MLTGNSFAFNWEVSLMEWLQSHLGSGTISVLSFLSAFGEELVLVLILGFIFWGYDKKLGKAIGLNVLMGLVWNPMLKNVAVRRRPYFDHEGIKILRLVDKSADAYDISAQGFSFPSGHSTNAVTLYGSLAAKKKSKALLGAAVALPLLVGFSRVVVGAHYPTDVLAGWALGLLSMAVVALLIMGTPSLRSYVLPVMMGLIAGTYSSIFVSGSIWYDISRIVKSRKGYKGKKKSKKTYKGAEKSKKEPSV